MGKMRSFTTALLATVTALLIVASRAEPANAKRVALVIGNDTYANVTDLEKAVNDARGIGAVLEETGFTVFRAENATRRQMNTEIENFVGQLESGDEALFFFAGHGVEIDGRNYLLPVDIPAAIPGKEGFVKAESVPVDQVLDRIRRRGTRVSVLILDACRDNPFPRNGTRSVGGKRGLARMPAPEGTFIMYSAGVGQTALDRLSDADPNPNSVFTRSLIPLLRQPGLSLPQAARQVRRQVQKLASAISHDQRPAYYDEVTGDFFFTKGPTDGNAPPSGEARSQDEILWASIEGSSQVSDYEFYLRSFPEGRFAALAGLHIDRLKRSDKGGDAPPEKPLRKADDLRGTWECAGRVASKCATVKCNVTAVVTTRSGDSNFAGRSHIICDTTVHKGCRLPASALEKRNVFGAISARRRGKSVQVTVVVDAPNEDMSSISEYSLKGDTLTFKRSLQGETTGYKETCRWIGPVNVASDAQH